MERKYIFMSVLLDDKQRDCIMTANNKYVVIDTSYTFEGNYETMVFKSDKNGIVHSWLDLDCQTYDNKVDAEHGHTEMINKWMKEVLVK